jgi:hypothetical protein
MSLDAPKSDAELLALHATRTGAKRVNGVELGPNSPIARGGSTSTRKPKPRANEADHVATEHALQVALFLRIRDPAEQRTRPDLAKVYAIPNGGYRTIAQAAKLRAEGVEPGVPDIDCPVARGGYFGLRIEMKRPGGTLKPSQVDRMVSLERDGYLVEGHESTETAWRALVRYLDLPPTRRGLTD